MRHPGPTPDSGSAASSPFDAGAARRLREALGLTPENVAYGMGAAYGMRIAPQTVAAWEAGIGAPDPAQLGALAGALWCAPSDLMGRPTTLRGHRLARGLALSDLALRIGMDEEAYARAERDGEWRGDDRRSAALAHALRLPLDAALVLTGKADRLAELLRGAVRARWQPYVGRVAVLLPPEVPRAETERVLRELHGAYQSATAGSLNWASAQGTPGAAGAGGTFLERILDHFWERLGTA
ncbi:XRE family transcriptional regulator [Streptomyces sp. NPDC054796]